jgi:hypothetical protein
MFLRWWIFASRTAATARAFGRARRHLQTDAKTPLHNLTIVNAIEAANGAKLPTGKPNGGDPR